jgi:uncharacterized protein
MNMNMMSNLLALQELDNKIIECNRVLKGDAHISLLKKLKGDFESLKENFNDKSEMLESVRQDLINLENRIGLEKKKLKQNEDELQKAAYSDYKQIENLYNKGETTKKELKKLEEDSIVLIDTKEKLSCEKEAKRVELFRLKENFYRHKGIFNDESTRSKDELERLRRCADHIRMVLPERVLQLYKSLTDKKGNAVAKLEGGMCSACRMRVSALTIDSVHKKQEVVCCNNCGRILFYECKDFGLTDRA